MSSPNRVDMFSSSSEESDEGLLSSVVTSVRKGSDKKDNASMPRTKTKDRFYEEKKESLKQRYLNVQKEHRQAKEELRKEERKRQHEKDMYSRDKYRRPDKSFSPKSKHKPRPRSISSSPDRFSAPLPKQKRPAPRSSKPSPERSATPRDSYESSRGKKDILEYRATSGERLSKHSARDSRGYKMRERSRSPQFALSRSKPEKHSRSQAISPIFSTSSSRNASPKLKKGRSVKEEIDARDFLSRKQFSRHSPKDQIRDGKPSSLKSHEKMEQQHSSGSESGLVDDELGDQEEDFSDGEMQEGEVRETDDHKEVSDSDHESDKNKEEEELEEEEQHPLIPKKSRFESSPSGSSVTSESIPGGRVIQSRRDNGDGEEDSNQDEEGNYSQYSGRTGSSRDGESPPGSAEPSAESEEEPEKPAESPPKPSKPSYYPAIQGCRSVEEFQHLNRIEEGTYGVVYRAFDKKCNLVVALKRLKMEKEKNGFPITSLREISTLMKAQHKNVVTVREVVVGSNMDKIYLVMDYVEHDLKALMETMKQPFLIGEIKCLMQQLLEAVHHLHDNWILHRDLKTSNLLLSHKGILKVGDFGLAREYGSPLKNYTDIVVTLWYRAPELLLGTKPYTCPIDLWSVGCIFGELLLMKPLFPGKGETDQLNLIFKDLGTPTERIWPGVSKLPGMKKCAFADYAYNQLSKRFGSLLTKTGFDFLNRFLTYNPDKRVTAQDALKHSYFDEKPLAITPDMFPTWPAKSEGDAPKRKQDSPRPPSGRKDLEDTDGGFHMSGASHGVAKSGIGFHLHF